MPLRDESILHEAVDFHQQWQVQVHFGAPIHTAKFFFGAWVSGLGLAKREMVESAGQECPFGGVPT